MTFLLTFSTSFVFETMQLCCGVQHISMLQVYSPFVPTAHLLSPLPNPVYEHDCPLILIDWNSLLPI